MGKASAYQDGFRVWSFHGDFLSRDRSVGRTKRSVPIYGLEGTRRRSHAGQGNRSRRESIRGIAMGEATKHIRISVADYLEGEKSAKVRHEYVDGEVFAMVGTTKAHNRIALNLALLLRNELAGSPCRVYMENVKVHIKTESEERFYYPDLHVECQPFTGNNRVVPLDNFMIYKDIIRLDRPD